MSRRQQPPLLPVIFDLLKVAPFWVGPILAVIVFVLFRFVSPAFIPATKGGIDSSRSGARYSPSSHGLLPGLCWCCG